MMMSLFMRRSLYAFQVGFGPGGQLELGTFGGNQRRDLTTRVGPFSVLHTLGFAVSGLRGRVRPARGLDLAVSVLAAGSRPAALESTASRSTLGAPFGGVRSSQLGPEGLAAYRQLKSGTCPRDGTVTSRRWRFARPTVPGTPRHAHTGDGGARSDLERSSANGHRCQDRASVVDKSMTDSWSGTSRAAPRALRAEYRNDGEAGLPAQDSSDPLCAKLGVSRLVLRTGADQRGFGAQEAGSSRPQCRQRARPTPDNQITKAVVDCGRWRAASHGRKDVCEPGGRTQSTAPRCAHTRELRSERRCAAVLRRSSSGTSAISRTLDPMAVSPFLERFGFRADPFESTDAEQEPELDDYFVPPPFFDAVIGDSQAPKSHVVLAPRGGGKTAQRKMIEYNSRTRSFLCVTYDEFDDLTRLSDATWGYHVNQLCRRMLLGVLVVLEEEPASVEKLSTHQKQLLKFQIQRFLGSLSAAQHERAVRSLKNFGDKARDFFHKYGGPISVLINALLSKLGLDRVELPGDLPEETKLDESLRYHYGHLLQIAQAVGFESTYILVDRVDELPATGTATRTFQFISPLLLDLRTLDADGVALKFFLWDQIETELDDAGFRRDRVAIDAIHWTLAELQEMLAQRLRAYSGGKVTSFNDLLCSAVALDVHSLLSHIGVGSPRDMIRCAKRIVSAETRTGTDSTCLSEDSVWVGVRAFCDERAGELVRAEYLAELKKVGRPTFTTSIVGSDIFRISTEGARQKIQAWARTGVVAKVDELPNQRDRPTHLYGVVDLRVAVAALPAMDVPLIISNVVLECPSCGVLAINDRQEITCPGCQTRFRLSDARSLYDAVSR
jgi:hypothetical protein